MADFELVIINAQVLTMDRERPTAQVLAVKDGRLSAIGSTGDLLSLTRAARSVVDAGGKTVLPGFIDNHTHLMQTGMAGFYTDLTHARSVAEVLAAVAAAAQKPGQVIRGTGFDDSIYPERRPPDRWDLDRVAPDHVVWLGRIDSHSCVVNSKTFTLLRLPAGTGGIDVDARGEPTGVLRGQGNSLARRMIDRFNDDETRSGAIRAAGNMAAAAGITSLCALEGGGGLSGDEDADYLLAHLHQVPPRVSVFLQTTDVNRVLGAGLPRIGGCLLIDGSFGSRTAALAAPYHDDPDAAGMLYFTQDEINAFVMEAHRAGLQVTTHVLGERAIDQMLAAYEKALAVYPRQDHRHRLEHFELPTREQIERVRRLGLVLSMQPAFEYFWGGPDRMYTARLGPERKQRTNPLRDCLDSGIVVAGGSDSDVTPMGPLLGVHAAVNHPNPRQRVTAVEALRMFTLSGAYAIFAEQERGSLREGKLADMVMLDRNPFTVPAGEIKDIQVEMTVVGGKIVYSRNPG